MNKFHRNRTLNDQFYITECLSFTNGSLTPEPSKVKKDFDALFETFIDCTNGTNEANVCDKCMNDYIELNNFYFKIGDITHGINGLCMDIVDLVCNLYSNRCYFPNRICLNKKSQQSSACS